MNNYMLQNGKPRRNGYIPDTDNLLRLNLEKQESKINQ